MTENRASKASAKYDAENTSRVYIKLNKKTDSDIIKWLDGKNNVQGTIKTLIRDAIQRDRMAKLHKRFALIDIPFSEFNHEEGHEHILESNDPEEILEKLSGDQTIEEFWADEDDEFTEGSDFWDSDGFKKSFNK